MNDKRAFRLLQREFTWQDGLYLWQGRITSALADPYLKTKGGKRFLLRFARAILEGKPKSHTALREMIACENHKIPFTEEQLHALPNALTLITLRHIVQTKAKNEREQAFAFGVCILRFSDRIDYAKLHTELSVLHHKLMELDLHSYRTLDDRSRAYVRNEVIRYAKQNHISQSKAAVLYAKDPPVHRTVRRRRMALSAFFLFGCLLSVACFLLFDPVAGLMLILPCFALAATLTQALLLSVFTPIPVLSLRPGPIPEKGATLVVITALLSGKESDSELFAKLRKYYYRNRQKNVRFGILADLPESDRSTDPKDEEITKKTLACLQRLETECGDHFCLFVRQRVRCATEGNYMGWERKRGAILELCRATRGKENTFSVCTLSSKELSRFRYLITLDSDTELGMDAVEELVFTMMHPENTPVVQNGAVVSGYGVLQPRMIPSPESACKTPYTVLQTGCGGKDSYGATAQDFDQNTFGKSSFCGKGIMDIDAFLETLDGAFPEERILSHDLLEGTRLRCGALCNHTFTDSVPKTPASFLKRQHRWMRGDLQSVPFSLPHHKNSQGQKVRNPIDPASRWQILRNVLFLLRPIFSFACIVYALFLPSYLGTALFFVATLHLTVPMLRRILLHAHHAHRRFYSRVLQNVWMTLLEMLYGYAGLAETAFLHLDALLRSLYRMLCSKKHLLQWVTAEHTELGSKNDLFSCLLFFWKSLVSGILFLIFAPRGILTLFGLLTALYPFACYFLGRPLAGKQPISEKEKQVLYEYAKSAYGYYTAFVTKENNYLPPDNYQYSPVARLAARTSPTNIGMYLLSTLAARDLGFLEKNELYPRLHLTLNTLERLPKYKGHLYNWYSTQTLDVIGTPYVSTVDSGNLTTALLTLREGIKEYCGEDPRLCALIPRINRLIDACDFSFLYNKERHLFCIGYDTASESQSENCYDLFMSESRTTSYYCIAKGIVEKKHWQYLGRPLLKSQGHMGMASWSGTAFEFFMPALFLPTVQNCLCYECLGFALYEQERDKSHGVWGRSESGYYAFDRELNYQYKAFGAHSLALDPDSAKNDVIAPYASILCLGLSHSLPLKNLEKLKKADMYGPYGFYEAIDYTPARVGGGYGIVRSYMAHHVGMSILAIANAVDGERFVHRFMHDPEMESATELLCERIPVDAPIRRRLYHRPMPSSLRRRVAPPEDFGKTNPTHLPLTAGLFTEKLSLWADAAGFVKIGSGEKTLTYPLCDERSPLRALRCLVKTDSQIFDVFRCENGKFGRFEDALVFLSDTKELRCQAAFTLSCKEPVLSLTLQLEGNFKKVTPLLFSEVILAKEQDWLSHPCYTGLFVECIYRAEDNALLFRKRPKEENEDPLWFLVTMEGGGFDFLCRRDEAFGVMYGEEDFPKLFEQPFSGRDGQCIFPFFCLRRTSECPRGKFACEFLFAVGNDEGALLRQIRRYRKEKTSTVGALLAPSYMQEIRARLLCSGYDRSLVRYEQVILSSILHDTRASADRAVSTHRELFWRHGISTDLPMIALYCTENRLSDNVKRILQGFLKTQKYLSLGGVRFDLLIFYRESEMYGCPQQKGIEELICQSVGESVLGHKGGVFPICDAQTLDAAPYLCPLFWKLDENSVFAKLVQTHYASHRFVSIPNYIQRPTEPSLSAKDAKLSLPTGAFLPNGVYRVNKSRCSMPQSYVYCSHQFGTLLTHNSAGVTYFRNASEFSLTERNTDPLLDMNGERLILKEQDRLYDLCAAAHTVDFTRSCAVYRGSTQFLRYEVRIGCDEKFPVKAIHVKLENLTDLSLPVSLRYEIKPSLGKSRVIRQKREGDTVFYRSLDRLSQPEELGMYLCEINLPDAIPAGESRTCHFLLGVINYRNDRSYYVAREALGTPERVVAALQRYGEHYSKIISKITLHSSSAALDVMFNGYIPYQVLTARIFARTGFYQCGGAYGFRDQLQDCINMIPLCQDLVRLQIIRCAARQYLEGDVQHWWHDTCDGPHGMRTRCSDDLLWLPFALAQYVSQTGKDDLLDLKIPYLCSPPLGEHESERYERPQKTAHRESIRMHCMRALDLALTRMGEHSLPLFGNGDWNDGMNRVGRNGKGESVWLAMFLITVLEDFSTHCLTRNTEDKERYLAFAKQLRKTVLDTCFENDRFLRGYFHDGTPLGSAQNKECQIDLLPQAFSVFLFPDDPKSRTAMESAYRELFDNEARILKLFAPAFDRSLPDPGYIRGYLPGIRENGGQYTHGAMWGALAFFRLGMYDKGYDVLCGSNPAARYLIPSLAGRYRLEPYFLAGDIYSGQHGGRGGWSLYTGAAGWFYTAVLKGMLGYTAKGGKIRLCPHLPTALDSVQIQYEKDTTVQSRTLYRSQNGAASIELT